MSTRKVMSGGLVAASAWHQPDDAAGRVAANAVVSLKRAARVSPIDNVVAWFEDASYGVSCDHRCSDVLPESRHDHVPARGLWGIRGVVRRVAAGRGGVGAFRRQARPASGAVTPDSGHVVFDLFDCTPAQPRAGRHAPMSLLPERVVQGSEAAKHRGFRWRAMDATYAFPCRNRKPG